MNKDLIDCLKYFGPLNATEIQSKLRLTGLDKSLYEINDALKDLIEQKKVRRCKHDKSTFKVIDKVSR